MDVTVADNPDEGRFEVSVDDELAGAAYYRSEGDAMSRPGRRSTLRGPASSGSAS